MLEPVGHLQLGVGRGEREERIGENSAFIWFLFLCIQHYAFFLVNLILKLYMVIFCLVIFKLEDSVEIKFHKLTPC